MLEAEFAEAMEKIIPSFNGNLDLLSHQLFLQSLVLDSNQQTLSIRKLACILVPNIFTHRKLLCHYYYLSIISDIAAYLYRSSSLELMKNTLKEISMKETTANQQKHKKDTGSDERKFWHSMDSVKKLANKIKCLN